MLAANYLSGAQNTLVGKETYMIENVRSLAFDTIQDILNEGE